LIERINLHLVFRVHGEPVIFTDLLFCEQICFGIHNEKLIDAHAREFKNYEKFHKSLPGYRTGQRLCFSLLQAGALCSNREPRNFTSGLFRNHLHWIEI
jgi:hypothetical protein